MQLTVKTTFYEFNEAFLSSLETGTLELFSEELKKLLKKYDYNLMGWRFLGKTEERLGNIENAKNAYDKVLDLFDPRKSGPGKEKLFNEIHEFSEKFGYEDLSKKIKFFKPSTRVSAPKREPVRKKYINTIGDQIGQ